MAQLRVPTAPLSVFRERILGGTDGRPLSHSARFAQTTASEIYRSELVRNIRNATAQHPTIYSNGCSVHPTIELVVRCERRPLRAPFDNFFSTRRCANDKSMERTVNETVPT